MPEQISKYPEVTQKVLESAGARCGEGDPQKILTECPADNFCSLPGGEVCVYGLDEIPQMTQVTPQELAGVVCPKTGQDGFSSAAFMDGDWLLITAVFLAGIGLGKAWSHFKQSSPG